jgi:hypothetical protein
MKVSPPLILSTLVVGGVAVAVVTLSATGCTRPAGYRGSNSDRVVTNPWQGVVEQLRKESDPADCRRVLFRLNDDLAQNREAPQPDSLTPDGEKIVRELLGLTDAEVKELRPASYTNLDPNYLAECLYLRDAARSLDVAGLPTSRQAELAFAWVCRQVVLNPWVVHDQRVGASAYMPPVPTTAVLRRASGSGLERAYVFLGLVRQLDLDGCLVGPPDAASRGWAFATESGRPPKGPFWAVGVRDGADILLFDPWRGEPIPGPDGKGIGTLAQVKADADLLRPWREDKDRPWDVAAEEVRASVPFLAVPMNAAAPRMKRLEEELRTDLPVRLAVELAPLRDRFATETGFPELKFWNPPAEQFSYTRVLGSFYPPEEGGHAPNNHLLQAYRGSLLPPTLFAIPTELLPQDELDVEVKWVIDRIRAESVSVFAASFLTPPVPREQIQRGQFFEVTPALVNRRQEFSKAQDRIRSDRDRKRALVEWAKKARELDTQLVRAQERGDAASLAKVNQAIERFWLDGVQTHAALIDLAAAGAGLAESTYLLAQCKHEQAEQLQARYERQAADPRQKASAEKSRAQAVSAWNEARGWWEKYEPYAATQDKTFAGRAAHAQELAVRAARAAEGLKKPR